MSAKTGHNIEELTKKVIEMGLASRNPSGHTCAVMKPYKESVAGQCVVAKAQQMEETFMAAAAVAKKRTGNETEWEQVAANSVNVFASIAGLSTAKAKSNEEAASLHKTNHLLIDKSQLVKAHGGDFRLFAKLDTDGDGCVTRMLTPSAPFEAVLNPPMTLQSCHSRGMDHISGTYARHPEKR